MHQHRCLRKSLCFQIALVHTEIGRIALTNAITVHNLCRRSGHG